jgi:hypothetical protein
MNKATKQKAEFASDIHITVEIDGKHAGCLDLNNDTLWASVKSHNEDPNPVEWIDAHCYEEVIQAAVILKFVNRLRSRIHQDLEKEIAQAKRDLERFCSKCKVAATVFGRAPRDIEKLVEADNCSLMDFYAFFWKYMLDERASTNLRDEWNASRNG